MGEDRSQSTEEILFSSGIILFSLLFVLSGAFYLRINGHLLNFAGLAVRI